MAGIYEPVDGNIEIDGAVTALLDASQGMNIDLTGRENIRLRGLYSGLNQAQIRRLEEDVANFAELTSFWNCRCAPTAPAWSSASGFALATAIQPQILLMDEWILAGDASFLDKARHRLEGMVQGAEILVLSSHSAEIIMRWCNRVIWMDGGQIKLTGPPEEVLAAYLPPEQFAHVEAVTRVTAESNIA